MGCGFSKVKEGGPSASHPLTQHRDTLPRNGTTYTPLWAPQAEPSLNLNAKFDDSKSISVGPLSPGIVSPFNDLPSVFVATAVSNPCTEPFDGPTPPSLPLDADNARAGTEATKTADDVRARREAAKAAAIAIAATLPSCASLYDTTTFAGEAERLEELYSINMLDTSPESRFDAITELAATLFDCPVAVVSLVDNARGQFKSNYGPFQGCVAREGSFCSYIFVPDYAEYLIVEDCTKDARFSGNPFVRGPPYLRYYAGCPLVTSQGHRIGTLCLCDFKPRYLPATAYNVMCNLAEIVVRELEREVVAERIDGVLGHADSPQTVVVDAENAAHLLEAPYCRMVPAAPAADEPLVIVNTADPAWPLVYCNEAWEEMVAAVGAGNAIEEALSNGNGCKKGLWELFAPACSMDAAAVDDPSALLSGTLPGRTVDIVATPKALNPNGEAVTVTVRLSFFQAARQQMANAVPVSIPGFVPVEKEEVDTPATLPLGALWIASARIVPPKTSVSDYYSFTRCSSITSMASAGRRPWSAASSYSPRSSFEAMAPRKPRRLASLQLGPLLGQGSFGRVYRGTLKDKAVAVKVIEVSPAAAPSSVRSSDGSSYAGSEVGFSSAGTGGGGFGGGGFGCGGSGKNGVTAQQAVLEAALSRHLAHPNIVPTLDYIVQDSGSLSATGRGPAAAAAGTQEVWIIQHLCDGGSLVDALERGALREVPSLTAPPSLSTILCTAHEIASALAYLHERDLLHGDLSGNNVLLSSAPNRRGWVALISDFGLARAAPSFIHTQTTGTVTHMPPELLMEGTLTKAADSYAFGVLMWEMWTGRRAYAGAALGAVIFQVTCRGKRLEMPEDCPEPLCCLAAACMDPDREKRPSCADAAAAIEAMMREFGVSDESNE